MTQWRFRRRQPPVRWQPHRSSRMSWQTPVIFGLLSFAIVLTIMTVIEKWPALSRISVASLTDHSPAARQISLPSL